MELPDSVTVMESAPRVFPGIGARSAAGMVKVPLLAGTVQLTLPGRTALSVAAESNAAPFQVNV